MAVAGTTYLQTLTLEPLALAAGFPVGALVTAVLVVNNLRDVDGDRRAGKRTLAVRLGVRGTVAEYDLLLALAFVTPLVLSLTGATSPPVLLALLSAPLALPLLRVVHVGGDPRRLNPVLRGTARLSLAFSALFAAGLAIPGLT